MICLFNKPKKIRTSLNWSAVIFNMNREIKFEYGFKSVNGIVKKVYHLHEIPNIQQKCDVWNVIPIVYVRQFTGLHDINGKEIYDGDIDVDYNVVAWCDETASWQWACYNFHPKEKIFCHFCEGNFNFTESKIEIIGNIYDCSQSCKKL